MMVREVLPIQVPAVRVMQGPEVHGTRGLVALMTMVREALGTRALVALFMMVREAPPIQVPVVRVMRGPEDHATQVPEERVRSVLRYVNDPRRCECRSGRN